MVSVSSYRLLTLSSDVSLDSAPGVVGFTVKRVICFLSVTPEHEVMIGHVLFTGIKILLGLFILITKVCVGVLGSV